VRRRNDDIVASLHNQSGLMDCFQIIQGSFARRDIFAEGSILGSTYLFGYFRIAILLTQMLALQESRPAARLDAEGEK